MRHLQAELSALKMENARLQGSSDSHTSERVLLEVRRCTRRDAGPSVLLDPLSSKSRVCLFRPHPRP